MKAINTLFLILKILAMAVVLALLGGGIYLFLEARDQERASQPYCLSWNKSDYDQLVKDAGITSFTSQINCNTYYLELTNTPVEALEQLATTFDYRLDFQFSIENGDQLIIGTLDQERGLLYSIS